MIKKTVAEELMSDLSEHIIMNYIEEGEKLPSERIITETFQCSRRAVRETLEAMNQMGIITIVPKKGVFLKDKRKLEIPVTSDITYTMSQIKDVLELRNTILKASINKCIKDEQPFDRIGLKELLKKIRESSEKKIPENEYRFQSLLVSPCKNNFYISMFRKMRNTFFACQYFLTDKTTLKQQIHLGYTTLLENLTAEPIQQISLTLDHILNIYVDNILLIEEKPINPIWRYLEDE